METNTFVLMPFLSFPEHNLKSIQDISTVFAAHTCVKQVALIFHLIFSVENFFPVVMEKVSIYGNEDVHMTCTSSSMYSTVKG